MSLGIISRAGRTYQDSAGYDLIQTDAGAYAGGSGRSIIESERSRDRHDHDGRNAAAWDSQPQLTLSNEWFLG